MYKPPLPLATVLTTVSLLCVWSESTARAQLPPVPRELARWLQPQQWERDTEGPILSLGEMGRFDDKHVFAPCVAHEEGMFRMWYSGARGAVAERVFRLGLATSEDGRRFQRSSADPVFEFGDEARSVLTPTLLRKPDGSLLREDGQLRMWFSSTDFSSGDGTHTLHETRSRDGMEWEPPSPALLSGVYAPTILKEGAEYRMWYTDVESEPWVIRRATSRDGRGWSVRAEPVLVVDQAWEQGRLFYPTVLKADGVSLMWYGSYWSAQPQKTALGMAASLDGIRWYKNPRNPVLTPEESRPWESHYTTSQSVLRLEDGGFRIWYASRTKPPFVHKYFAINTARWSGPLAASQALGVSNEGSAPRAHLRGPLSSDDLRSAETPGVGRDEASAKSWLVVLIGGFASDPTPRQIDGTARRGEGNSGMYRLRGDLMGEGIAAEYFNWNGTRGGQSKSTEAPMAGGIVRFLRERRAAHPEEALVIVGNSWGGHTAWEVCESLSREPAIPVELVVFLDPSSAARAPRPQELPANVRQAVNYYTHNLIGWREWPNEERIENIDLGDPERGFLRENGPRYDAAFDMKAHISAEWDEHIHRDIRERIARLIRPSEAAEDK